VEESTPELPAAMTNHMGGLSDVTTRSRREQQHEQECPAARRGGRCVSASELVGFGTGGGEEARGTSKGRLTRTRKIGVSRRASGDRCQREPGLDFTVPQMWYGKAYLPS
jgi:hypothetical protein